MLDCDTMETISQLVALCRGALAGGAWADGAWLIASLPASLFVAGLVGGALHCSGMCGPFVLSQVMADAERTPASKYGAARYGEWRRLSGAALVPYHLGRLTSYTLLGAIAGTATALFAATPLFGWLSGGLLIVAACLMALQAIGMTRSGGAALPSFLAASARRLSTGRHASTRYALGVVLGFLPCGLLYGALAAAAGTASAVEGATVMAAFALGTAPALIAVGWGGLIVRRRLRDGARWLATPLLLANAGVMLALASQRL